MNRTNAGSVPIRNLHSWVNRLAIAVLLLAAAAGRAATGEVAAAATAPTGVTIAVTGDIYTPGAQSVSDAILAHKPFDAVLLVGDTCNGSPMTPVADYQRIYRGTYGRFLDRIQPCPGNHDKLTSPPFSGYRSFWGAAAHAPEQYYSFELGAWHAVSLDSVTFRDGGPKAAAQLDWLKADLAANPGKPVVAYWHYPFFSRAKHCGDPKMKPLWEALAAHGPALVFNGHNHVYERYEPLDPDGKPVAETSGIQEFVIGPGGASPVKEESSSAKGPASKLFHGGAQHVGFFTLQAGGAYQFSVESVASDGTTKVVDSGAGKLLAK